jgi:hypothetical protein
VWALAVAVGWLAVEADKGYIRALHQESDWKRNLNTRAPLRQHRGIVEGLLNVIGFEKSLALKKSATTNVAPFHATAATP